jgi:signal transduction histidine kinase
MEFGSDPRSASRAALRWGFAGTIVLALTVGAVSVVEVQRSRREVRNLALTADRSSYLVGEIARHVSRLRTLALERLLAGEAGAPTRGTRDIERALDRVLLELEPLLQADERDEWRRFLTLLGHFRGALANAGALLGSGRHDEARTILTGRVTRTAERMHRELDRLAALNQEESQQLLATADRRLSQVRLIEAILALLLAGGLGAIWASVLRTVGRQQAALAEHVRRIEASNRDLDAFAGRIAHDLRNVLAPFAVAPWTLRHAREQPGALDGLAVQLERGVRRSAALIDALLAFSRAGHSPDTRAAASLPAVVQDVADECAAPALATGATLAVEVPELVVACPPGLLHLLVANLLGNALKFLDGCDVRQVTVSARARDDRAELVIQDSGPGIPRDSLARIFEPFYRVPGSKAPGTGIGLATVRRIVDAYGGTVEVESGVGLGTVFRVSLPLARTGAREPGVPPTPYGRPRQLTVA